MKGAKPGDETGLPDRTLRGGRGHLGEGRPSLFELLATIGHDIEKRGGFPIQGIHVGRGLPTGRRLPGDRAWTDRHHHV
jgi:hypothetical protein